MFPRVKPALAIKSMGPETFQREVDGVTRMLVSMDYATASLREVERHDKCIHVAGNYIKKSF